MNGDLPSKRKKKGDLLEMDVLSDFIQYILREKSHEQGKLRK